METNYLKRLAKVQNELSEHISIVKVLGEREDLRWVSYKVPREIGLVLEQLVGVDQKPVRVVIQDRNGALSVRKITLVNNDPTPPQLSYAMRWVYQILEQPQFLQCHLHEEHLMNSNLEVN